MRAKLPEKQSAILTLLGPCPSKKNLWKRGKGGRTYIDAETAALISALTAQAEIQWQDGRSARRKPVTHPDITMLFYVTAMRQDRDNMATTILDCLVSAGVLKNDNLAQCNGMLTILPAVKVKAYERVVVGVSWQTP